MRRPIVLMLTIILLINLGSPAVFCASLSIQTPTPAAKHCTTNETTTVLPCCRQDRGIPHTLGSRLSASTCCRLSPSLPNRSASTPALSSEGLKTVQADFDITSFWPQAFRASADLHRIAFLANRSYTYLQLS